MISFDQTKGFVWPLDEQDKRKIFSQVGLLLKLNEFALHDGKPMTPGPGELTAGQDASMQAGKTVVHIVSSYVGLLG